MKVQLKEGLELMWEWAKINHQEIELNGINMNLKKEFIALEQYLKKLNLNIYNDKCYYYIL